RRGGGPTGNARPDRPHRHPDRGLASEPHITCRNEISGRSHQSGGSMTRIAVDPGRLVGHVDRRIFGGFIEHLGRCIYGGIFDEGSALADLRGFRTDVLALLLELRPGIVRWPGGNFASNYHWTDGIGPKDTRPRRPELAWGGVESNRFGTDEFLSLCTELGTEPYICLNMGTGSLPEALAWIEYCNCSGDTEWARPPRAKRRDEPY